MIVGFACVRRPTSPDFLYVYGVTEPNHDIIDFERMPSGDIIVLVRRKGRTDWAEVGRTMYYPTTYSVALLVPVDLAQHARGSRFREIPRAERPDFRDSYFINAVYVEFQPGRRRREVTWKRELLHKFAAGKKVNWNSKPKEQA